MAAQVVGRRGQPYLQGGFGQPAPAHPPQAVAPLPSAKDLLDPSPDKADHLVPDFQASPCLLVAADTSARQTGLTASRSDQGLVGSGRIGQIPIDLFVSPGVV